MAKKKDPTELEIVDELIAAKRIADAVFGAQANADAVERIFDFLSDGEVTPDEFTADLKCVHGYAVRIYGTSTPSPAEVFGVFDRVFDVG